MRRLLVVLGVVVVLMATAVSPSSAGTTARFRNCCPGKALVLHWHNYRCGYVDVYWSRMLSNLAAGDAQYAANLGTGDHSVNTGISALYYGYGTPALRAVDKTWTSCSSAV